MTKTLDHLLPVAEEHDVMLCIEPEKANVVNSAAKARRLMDDMQSRHLGIVIDGANLFDPADVANMRATFEEAFDLLGPHIIMAHAKDITPDTHKKSQAAGTGILDWHAYFFSMHRSGFDGPVILHNLDESQVADSLAFVRHSAGEWYPSLISNGE